MNAPNDGKTGALRNRSSKQCGWIGAVAKRTEPRPGYRNERRRRVRNPVGHGVSQRCDGSHHGPVFEGVDEAAGGSLV
jgi:hypothetical protein